MIIIGLIFWELGVLSLDVLNFFMITIFLIIVLCKLWQL